MIYVYGCILIDATVYVGGLDEKVSETVLWELFLQAGPVGKGVWLSIIIFIHYTYISKCSCPKGQDYPVSSRIRVRGVHE